MKLVKYLVSSIFFILVFFFNFQISLAQGSIEDTLDKINKTNLPQSVKIIPVGQTVNLSNNNSANQTVEDIAGINTAGQYSLAASGKTSELTSNNFASFFARLIAAIKDFFDFGNKKARQYAGTQLPAEAVNQTVAKSSNFTQKTVSYDDSQPVLGIFDNRAMEKALPVLQCGNLPYGLGNCPQGGGLFTSPTPPITPLPTSQL